MNKKIIMFALLCVTASTHAYLEHNSRNVDVAITSGFVWKDDSLFKSIYGPGIIDIITADACYYPCTYGGIGIKTSLWAKKGKTTPLKHQTKIQEIPLIGYIRGCLGTQLQLYVSLGAGIIFIKEKSYLGSVSTRSAIGETEVGVHYYLQQNIYLTTAFRVLFSHRSFDGQKVDLGGYDVTAGAGLSF